MPDHFRRWPMRDLQLRSYGSIAPLDSPQHLERLEKALAIWSEDGPARRTLGASDLAIGTRMGVRLGSTMRLLWVVIWSNP